MKEFNFSLEPGRIKYTNRDYADKNPIISVVVPFYNSGRYIEQTIISVLNQTFPYFELLIIDDGSKDEESLKKLEEIQKLDNSDIIQAMAGNVLELYNKQMSKIISMEDGKLDIKDNYIKVYSATQTAYVSLDGSIKTDFEIFPENIHKIPLLCIRNRHGAAYAGNRLSLL